MQKCQACAVKLTAGSRSGDVPMCPCLLERFPRPTLEAYELIHFHFIPVLLMDNLLNKNCYRVVAIAA